MPVLPGWRTLVGQRRCKVLMSEPVMIISAKRMGKSPYSQLCGLNLRKPLNGPEHDLVQEYVESNLPMPSRGISLTVFIEPEIESGFPDVVAAYSHVATTRRWKASRISLTKADVRIAHFLATMGPSSIDALGRFFPNRPKRSLERLLDAGVVQNLSGRWVLKPVRDVFAIRRLVAIEAKVLDWQEGLRQALQNVWFASESYLLLPKLPKTLLLKEEAARFGVGLRVQGQPLDDAEKPSRLSQIPASYASWLFNEWAWRLGCME